MRATATAFLFACFTLLAGCHLQDEAADPAAPATGPELAPAPRELGSIVFRARYYRSKECMEGPKGELALGDWDAYEVVEVLKGDLPLKGIKGPQAPAGVTEGGTYLFRWTPPSNIRQEMRKARDDGFKGIWLLGEQFELVPTQKLEP
jgi:hypothetical protein